MSAPNMPSPPQAMRLMVLYASIHGIMSFQSSRPRTTSLAKAITTKKRQCFTTTTTAHNWPNLSSTPLLVLRACRRCDPAPMFAAASRSSSRNHMSLRLFGSKVVPGNPPGDIYVENDQSDLAINVDQLRITIHNIRCLLHYPTYDMACLLVHDAVMQATNFETRHVNAPTDVLSFPFHAPVTPGVLEPPLFDIADYYNLGDVMINVPYVMRQCRQDEMEHAEQHDERGVAGAMARVRDAETRMHMLLVHGMLHLVGYDHETDHDYEAMIAEEERILRELGLPLPKNSNRAVS